MLRTKRLISVRWTPLLITTFLLIWFMSGCVVTTATMLGTATMNRAAIAPQAVRLYRTADLVPGKYEEVALLHSKGDYSMTNEPQMFESMKKKAAELGANGVILDALTEPSAGAKIAGAFLGYSAQRTGMAVAIYIYPQGEEPITSATQTGP